MNQPPPYDYTTLGETENGTAEIDKTFVGIFKKTHKKYFVSYQYNHAIENPLTTLPKSIDIVAHLKLLKAFEVMKKHVFCVTEIEATEKHWQVFITNAVRRFIIFVSCLKHDTLPLTTGVLRDEEMRFNMVAENLQRKPNLTNFLPPLDILMVWHAFLLNPRSFYDTFQRNDFFQFADLPLPFVLINDAIDNVTFEYNPDEKAKLAYYRIIEPFLEDNSPNQIIDIRSYDIYDGFAIANYFVDIKCPNCGEIVLENVPLTTPDSSGFADTAFLQKATSCECDFSPVVNHVELRKRQLYSDLHNEAVLPGIYRYYSSVLSHATIKDRSLFDINDNIVKVVEASTDNYKNFKSEPLLSILEMAVLNEDPDIALQLRLILRNYLGMNLIHSTVHSKKVPIIEISEDLVGCVLRQYRFVEKMNKLDWLHSPVVEATLDEASRRYKRFFTLLIFHDQKRLLVPTLDIDLVWHTHQLSAHYYFKDCLEGKWGCVVDHDDKVEQSRIDDSFEKTAKLYKTQFKEDYAVCFCWYCVGTRSKKLFGRKKSALLAETEQHISTHNAIELQTPSAKLKRAQLEKKYPKEKNNLPWTHPHCPDAYVVATDMPIPEEHSLFYGDALCTTVRDYGATCAGLSCGNGSAEGPNTKIVHSLRAGNASYGMGGGFAGGCGGGGGF